MSWRGKHVEELRPGTDFKKEVASAGLFVYFFAYSDEFKVRDCWVLVDFNLRSLSGDGFKLKSFMRVEMT